MKTFLSTLLGIMLLTSLVGFSYATPNPQPLQNNNTNPCVIHSPNYDPDCHVGKGSDPHNGNNNGGGTPCTGGASPKSPDAGCTCTDSTNGLEDNCCPASVTPNNAEASDNQPDTVLGC